MLASAYVAATSHTRHRLSGRVMDFSDRPWTEKRYPGLPRVDLNVGTLADTSLAVAAAAARSAAPLDSQALAALLVLSRTPTAGTADHVFYSAPSAGALYPVEIHVVTAGVAGMEDGLYYYDARHAQLVKLRAAETPGLLPEAPGPCAWLFFTIIFHRSAWKYGARAYRYCLLDTGHMLENAWLGSRALGLDSQLALDFDDAGAARLLGLDPEREACLAILRAGPAPASDKMQWPPAPLSGDPAHETLLASASRCARSDMPPAEILQAHSAGASSGFIHFLPTPASQPAPPLPPQLAPLGMVTLPQALAGRRSHRAYASALMDAASFEALCALMRQPYGQPVQGVPGGLEVRLLTEGVQGLGAGRYRLPMDGSAPQVEAEGQFLTPMAKACLDQMWLARATVHVCLTADLTSSESEVAPRAYRYAGILAGRIGQRLYLAARPLGLGCCGIGAYFDNEALRLLHLPDGHGLLYHIALGHASRQAS